ncbi:hypothetical protein BU26DRAFT_259123 [Trematosphaeria pertusa]|uniref:Uncharacterized protein n=1 Tax=Trematosphaeria pertusa TaxID=390896 RepID=A0A6A6IQJ7_9PLEO|nr:uncharacterized protein BU26DRAFT_259123 [Trematosphaeria pertusa]KAF2252569.1 hypothetical protein BU26DRAFT_259123 [Trematosphaeria pertusa]
MKRRRCLCPASPGVPHRKRNLSRPLPRVEGEAQRQPPGPSSTIASGVARIAIPIRTILGGENDSNDPENHHCGRPSTNNRTILICSKRQPRHYQDRTAIGNCAASQSEAVAACRRHHLTCIDIIGTEPTSC